jgi:long-chain acyl-CoA synthetase
MFEALKEKTVHAAIGAAALSHPDKAAFFYYRDGWKGLTFGEFMKNAGAMAAGLSALGLRKGGRVALVSENRHEWCASYTGILMAGGMAVPVDARLTPGEIKNILVDSEASCVVHTEATGPGVKEASVNLGIPGIDMDSFGWEGPAAPFEPHAGREEDVASLLYTSGTTGVPKAVMLTHKNLLSDAKAVIDLKIMSGKDRVLSILPLHHTYSFMCTFLCPVLLGAGITYPQGLKGPEILAAVRETGVTALIGVPQLLELMLKRITDKMDALPKPLSWAVRRFIGLSGLIRRRTGANPMKAVFKPMGRQFRFFTSGGARLDPGVMAGLEALGFTVIEGYGLTETSPIVCFNPPARRKPGSVGRAVPGAEIKILMPSGQGEGEVAVRGPMAMKGYYRRPVETEAVMDDGWFKTGDLGYLDGEGYLYLTGRLKEVIVLSSGKNVYPEEVENHYARAPLIKEICVVEREGRLGAVVVPDMAEVAARRVGNINETLRWEMGRLSGGLPPHMRVMGYTIRQEPLPRTPLGKLRRFIISEGVMPGAESREEDKALTGDETGRRVLECLGPFLEDGAPVRSGDNLELDLGLDSLKRVEFAASLDRAFSLKLPEAVFYDVHTVGGLVQALKDLDAGAGAADYAAGEGMESVLMREPSEEERMRVGLLRGRFDWPVTVFFLVVLKALMKLLFRLETSGKENIPGPPFIIAANHTSYLDGPVIGAAVPYGAFRGLYFLGLRRFFRGPVMSRFARLAHVISIDADNYVEGAMGLSSYALRSGHSVAVFPEGGRSFGSGMMDFKKGVGILALRLGVPVVPVWIEGALRALPRGSALLRPAKIRVVFGKPVMPGRVDFLLKPGEKDPYQLFADELRQRVAELGNP